MLVADQLALMAASWQAVRGATCGGGMTKCGGGADGATARGKERQERMQRGGGDDG